MTLCPLWREVLCPPALLTTMSPEGSRKTLEQPRHANIAVGQVLLASILSK